MESKTLAEKVTRKSEVNISELKYLYIEFHWSIALSEIDTKNKTAFSTMLSVIIIICICRYPPFPNINVVKTLINRR